MAFYFLYYHQIPVCVNLSIFYRFLFFTKLGRIALQRSEEARILFRSNVCLLDPEMLVFLDESGFVSFQLLLLFVRFDHMSANHDFFVNLLLSSGQKNFSHLRL